MADSGGAVFSAGRGAVGLVDESCGASGYSQSLRPADFKIAFANGRGLILDGMEKARLVMGLKQIS
jgi:hypothetical protein